jgi:hypothetical protein
LCCVLLALLLFWHLLTLPKEKPQEHLPKRIVVALLSPYAYSTLLVSPYTCPPVRAGALFLAPARNLAHVEVEAHGNQVRVVATTSDGVTASKEQRCDGPVPEVIPLPNLRRDLMAIRGVPEEKRWRTLGEPGIRESPSENPGMVLGIRELCEPHAHGQRDSPADEPHTRTHVRELHTRQPARRLRLARKLLPVDALPRWWTPADALPRLLEPADARDTLLSVVLPPAAVAAAVVAAADELQRPLGCSSSDAAVVAVAAVQKPLLSAAFEQCTLLSGALAHDPIEPQHDVRPFWCFRRRSSLSS